MMHFPAITDPLQTLDYFPATDAAFVLIARPHFALPPFLGFLVVAVVGVVQFTARRAFRLRFEGPLRLLLAEGG
jgi:hypothetical protein